MNFKKWLEGFEDFYMGSPQTPMADGDKQPTIRDFIPAEHEERKRKRRKRLKSALQPNLS